MPFVTALDGIRLKYELMGEGPALFLHVGAGCDRELWRAAGYAGPLSESYRCILFDHRGHGESDNPRGADAHHVDRYADDVVAVLDHLAIESCAFWGYSSGIEVGLKVADDHPSRLWALVGSGAFVYTPPDELGPHLAHRIEEFRLHGWEKLLARFDGQERDPVPQWMKNRIRATDVQQFMDSLEAVRTGGWNSWEALTRVIVPTLFLTGELEDPNDETARAAARMPNGRRVRLAGLGHINAFLRSDLVLPQALEFLNQHADSPAML